MSLNTLRAVPPFRASCLNKSRLFLLEKLSTYQNIISLLDTQIGFKGGKYTLDETGKMALICWAVKHHFPDLLFVGFYRITKNNLLTIGPYQGDVMACGTIPFGIGVCGVAAEKGKTIIVNDVSKFPDYISCDSDTKSEIVVPVVQNEKVTAVLDVDSVEIGCFDETDNQFLGSIIQKYLSD